MMSATTRIQVNDSEGIKVVRFHGHQLFDEHTVREIADQIAEALPNDGSPIRLVVDFSDVSLISSTFLSKLILLQHGLTQRAASCGSAKWHRSSSRSSAPRTWIDFSRSTAISVPRSTRFIEVLP